MPVLDDLSGLEFEAIMVDVFSNYGYENVEQTPQTGDEGRDILMEETVNGQRREIVVECKHMDQVGREIVQKLHSAALTHDNSAPVRGMVVTTGIFTDQAKEHVDKIRAGGDGMEIELVDGNRLREISEEAGLDLQNGKVELVCRHTLPPGDIEKPVLEQFDSVNNIEPSEIGSIESSVQFYPVVSIEARTDAKFETSVGVIHRVNECDTFHLRGNSSQPKPIDDSLQQFLDDDSHQFVELNDPTVQEGFDSITIERFRHAESDFKEWAADQVKAEHTETVEYTGKNNVDYDKECVPSDSDISITNLTPMYVPRIRSKTRLLEHGYSLEYDAAGENHRIIENGIFRCNHCGWSWISLTYCENCGSINCWRHIRTERVEGTPVCTECAVTGRFALRKRFFYDKENMEQFREEFEQYSPHKMILENRPAIIGFVLVVLVALIYLL
ncbi:restriction endonuclease [Halocatena halophila]|uniref:restriction endonuclease n=1 Tax=Halocatena halophila TaxID=2814576 RepID=UPI002ED5052A